MLDPVRAGQRLGGRYRIDGTLARGGSATVLAGTDLQADRAVAIKLMMPEHARSEASRSRFQREIRVLRQLRSDSVVHVIDEGSLPTGEPFMVMERLSGRTLKDVLLSQGPLPVPDAVDYVLQACEVLAEAHVAGVVHRDVKPENLFLVDGESACIKVLDFGLSKAQAAGPARDEREPSITRGNEVMGSPQYMAPEQLLSSRHVDRSADIWSVGVVLYELLAGRLPFGGETVDRLRANVMMSAPDSLTGLREDIAPELEAIVMRCLAKVPEERFKGLAVVAAALSSFGGVRAKASAARILEATPSKVPPPLPSTPPVPRSKPPPLPLSARPAQPAPAHVPPSAAPSASVHHGPLAPSVPAPRASCSERRARRARRSRLGLLMGVSVVFFTLGLALGVVLSVWQHHRPHGDGRASGAPSPVPVHESPG